MFLAPHCCTQQYVVNKCKRIHLQLGAYMDKS